MTPRSAGRERRRPEEALLDSRYLGPSLYGFQLAAFLDHFDRGQVLVIASEVLRDRPREVLSAAIPPELRDRLTESLAADLHRFEHLLGHEVPSHWGWSTSSAVI